MQEYRNTPSNSVLVGYVFDESCYIIMDLKYTEHLIHVRPQMLN